MLDKWGRPDESIPSGGLFLATTSMHLAYTPGTLISMLAEDISLALSPTRSGFGGITLAHNVRTREEVARVLDHAKAAGAAIVKPAQDVFWGGHSGYFTAPDGYYWEVAFASGCRFAADGSLILDE